MKAIKNTHGVTEVYSTPVHNQHDEAAEIKNYSAKLKRKSVHDFGVYCIDPFLLQIMFNIFLREENKSFPSDCLHISDT